MTPVQSLSIVRALADGLDPHSGLPLPKEGVLQDADVVRALHVAVSALEKLAQHSQRTPRAPRDASLPSKAGQPWTDDEDRQLCSAFDAGATIDDLATSHSRTVGAIKSRLEKQGRLPPAST